jgi:2-oxoglutarate dehydrogenase E2 component (dihydrolipoamide succinyltransferase)
MNDMSRKPDNLQILVPLQQEGTKAVVRTWLIKAGEPVKKDQPVVELETDKVVVEVCAPADGVLSITLQEDAEALPGAQLGTVAAGVLETPDQLPAAAVQAGPAAAGGGESISHFHPELRLSPAVRRLLAEHQLDPASLQGTGRGGRLTREDVMARLQSSGQPPVAAPEPTASGPRVAEHIPHDSMRRRIADHMQHSVSTAPHVTAVFEADFSAIIRHRQQHKAEFAAQGVNLTFTAYFIAAAVQAMQAAPQVNSRWHADFLEVFKDVNIGVGAALGDKGLIVPVIHRAQELSLLGIASRLQQVTEAARTGKLKPADVQGGTFTVSNHGVSGSLLATPIIINQPQSAILGIGALEKRVVVTEVDGVDTFQARPRAYVSLTIDHRVLDGSQTNAWLSRFVEVLQGWG